MRSKTPLALMEQLVMVLVFALAAALCIQAFAASDRISGTAAARDRAVQLAQSAAEIMKSRGGDLVQAQSAAMERLGGQLSQGVWYVLYDRDWNEVSDGSAEAVYRLEAQPDSNAEQPKADIRVSMEDGKTLIALPVVWQEVGGDA
ncbi:hypothetical protein OBV_10170 [Oscillibacter valericigenes Sjm18-20]|nr:hypothetical protein OBV_10170 [Oscillibacter valericigenes Sjm18-20]